MKDDFLMECMSEVNGRLRGMGKGPIPLNEFNLINCRLCAHRDCARSGMNNSVFDKRVRNWREKLFTDVPRADEEDPKWDHFRAKKFVPADPSSMEVKSFQPLPVVEKSVPEPEMEAPEPELEPPPAPEPEPPPEPEPEPPPAPAPEPEPEMPVPELDVPPPEQAPPPVAGPPIHQMKNTPFTQGTVLPESDGDGDVVMEPGGTYTFGDD